MRTKLEFILFLLIAGCATAKEVNRNNKNLTDVNIEEDEEDNRDGILEITKKKEGMNVRECRVRIDDPKTSMNNIYPVSLIADVGGFLGSNYSLQLTGKELKYLHRENTSIDAEVFEEALVVPNDNDWINFKRSLNQACVWDWERRYEDPEILDGTQWSFSVEYDDARVFSTGSNAYPEGFYTVFKAVSKLIGGRNFR